MGEPFQLLVDRALTNVVTIAEWCPTMDLLCMVNDKNELLIQRAGSGSSWSRLLLLGTPSSAPVIALAWRLPDGKAIACGYEDGTMTLYDVESGIELLSTQRDHAQAPIRTLHWAAAPVTDRSDQNIALFPHQKTFENRSLLLPDRATDMLEDLVEESNLTADFHAIAESARGYFPILCSVSESIVCLSAFGNFQLGRLTLGSGVLQSIGCSITKLDNAYLSPDVAQLTLVANDCQKLAWVDTRILRDSKEELCAIANESFHISMLLQQSGLYVNKLLQEWKSLCSSLHSKFSVYQQLLQEDGSNSSLENDLVLLLTAGVSCSSLDRLLGSSLKSSDMTRLARSIDSSCATIQSIGSEHLVRAMEALLFRLGELQGLAYCPQYMQIGLDQATLEVCLQRVGGFVLLMDQLMESTKRFRLLQQNFFQWITKAQLSLQNSKAASWKPVNQTIIDETLVCEFLDNNMTSVELDELLQQAAVLSSVTPTEQSFVRDQGFMFAVPVNRNVQVNFTQLEEHCHTLFQATSRCCSESFHALGYLSLPELIKDQNGHPMIHIQNYQDAEADDVHVIAYASRAGASEQIHLIQMKEDGGCETLLLELSEASLLQMEFYTPSTLALLVSQEEEHYLVLENYEEHEWVDNMPLCDQEQQKTLLFGDSSPVGMERRRLLDGKPGSLSVGPGRGVGAICYETKRITVFDLEDDELSEEEEEENDADEDLAEDE